MISRQRRKELHQIAKHYCIGRADMGDQLFYAGDNRGKFKLDYVKYCVDIKEVDPSTYHNNVWRPLY